MLFRKPLTSFLKPLSGANPPIEISRQRESHRYLDGELTTTLHLTPDQRIELERRYKELQIARDGVAAVATEDFNLALKQITKARDAAINNSGSNFDRARWDLLVEFRTPAPLVLGRPKTAPVGPEAADKDGAADQKNSQSAFTNVGTSSRRRQPVPAAAPAAPPASGGIPNELETVIAEQQKSAQPA